MQPPAQPVPYQPPQWVQHAESHRAGADDQIFGGNLLWGTGVPAASLGVNGNFYFRTDTPGSANQRLYVKSAGSWTGIL